MGNYIYPADKAKSDINLILKELLINSHKLLDDLVLEKDKLIANGLTERQALDDVLNQVQNEEGVFKTFVNGTKSRIRALEKSIVAKPVMDYASKNPDQKLRWVLGSIKTSHCGDCISLSNMSPMTLKEWRAIGYGLPREGLTECNVGCRCMLVPVN